MVQECGDAVPILKRVYRTNRINIVKIKELMGHAGLTSTIVYQNIAYKP